MVTIICVGKKHESVYMAAIANFEERIKPYMKQEWKLLPHSSLEGKSARKEESERILRAISPNNYVILLDELGLAASSPELAIIIDRAQNSSRNISVIIGGAYGVDDSVKQRADYTLSFGHAVFPHQLMRVMVIEQLYRAYSILAGTKYHHT